MPSGRPLVSVLPEWGQTGPQEAGESGSGSKFTGFPMILSEGLTEWTLCLKQEENMETMLRGNVHRLRYRSACRP